MTLRAVHSRPARGPVILQNRRMGSGRCPGIRPHWASRETAANLLLVCARPPGGKRPARARASPGPGPGLQRGTRHTCANQGRRRRARGNMPNMVVRGPGHCESPPRRGLTRQAGQGPRRTWLRRRNVGPLPMRHHVGCPCRLGHPDDLEIAVGHQLWPTVVQIGSVGADALGQPHAASCEPIGAQFN